MAVEVSPNLTQTLSNLPLGCAFIFDIDETLLYPAVDKYNDAPRLTEPRLPAVLKHLQASGHRIVCLSARAEAYRAQTEIQLAALGLPYDVLLHAPNEHRDGHKTPTKGKVLKAHLASLPDSERAYYQHLAVFDNLVLNLSDIEADLSDSDVSYELYHYIPDTRLLVASDGAFPPDLSGYERVDALGGGSKSTYEISNGSESLVLKHGINEEAIQVEILMKALYRVLGVQVPDIEAYHHVPEALARSLDLPKTGVIVQCSPKLTLLGSEERKEDDEEAVGAAEQKEGDEANTRSEIANVLKRDFVANAVLGNIDAANPGNYLPTEDGAVLVDAGANFIFRALGKDRKESANDLVELSSLRDSSKNETSAGYLTNLSDDEIREQALSLLAKREELECTLLDVTTKLRFSPALQSAAINGFAARFNALANIYGQSRPIQSQAAEVGRTSAGVLTLRHHLDSGEVEVLLSRRARHEWYANFGGKSDAEDTSLATTAAREVFEESSGQLHYDANTLLHCSFHDAITTNRRYRLYFAFHDAPLDSSKMVDKEHGQEHKWVPLSDVLRAATDSEWITLEDKKTLSVTSADHNIPLMPEFAQLLKQEPVQTLLSDIVQTKVLPRFPIHTQGERGVTEQAHEFRALATVDELTLDVEDTLFNNSHVLMDIKQGRWEELNRDKLKKRLKQLGLPEEVESNLTNKRRVLRDLKQRQLREGFNQGKLKKRLKQLGLPGEVESTLHNKCRVLRELKQHHRREQFNEIESQLSQSELHLQAVLGNDYVMDDMQNNVTRFVDRQYPDLETEEKAQLIAIACNFIQVEKSHPEHIYFYHGCPDFIAFSYMLYTAIYQILLMDDRYHQFRSDHLLFHELKDIHAFIQHFTTQSRHIDNYDEYYKELALSTNLFLFGNHENATSHSVAYLLGQRIRQNQVKLSGMLGEIFRPMGVPERFVNQAVQLFDTSILKGHTALYQLQMSAAESAKYVYLAKVMGKLNPWPETECHDPREALKRIREEGALAHANYILSLQTRVMAPPQAKIRMRKVHWDMTSDDMLAVEEDIARLASGMVQAMLHHNRHKQLLNVDMPLVRQLGDILRGIGLSSSYRYISNEALVELVNTAQYDTLRTLISQHPDIKHRVVQSTEQRRSARRRYALIGQNNGHQRTYLLDVLTKRKDATDFIFENYGPQFYRARSLPLESVAQHIRAENEDDFRAYVSEQVSSRKCSLLKALHFIAPAHTLAFVTQHQGLITDIENLLQVIEQLKEEERVGIATQHQGLMKSGFDLAEVIWRLKEDDILDFATQHQGLLTSSEALAEVVEVLKEEDRLNFVTQHLKEITSVDDLIRVLGVLNKEDRPSFAAQHQAAIEDVHDLSAVLLELKEEDRFDFATQHQALITEVEALFYVLRKLREDDRLPFACQCQTVIRYDFQLTKVLDELAIEDRLSFATQKQDLFESVHNLATTLGKLKQDDKLGFATANQKLITNGSGLSAVLSTLNKEDRLEFATQHQSIMTTGSELAGVLCALNEDDRLPFATQHQGLITCAAQLPRIVYRLKEEDKLPFASQHQGLITNAGELARVIGVLRDTDGLNFAIQHHELITDANELVGVLKVLNSKEDRLSFAMQHQALITNVDELARVINQLNEMARLTFASQHQTLITDFDALKKVLDRLNIADKFIFATQHQGLITSASELASVLHMLDEADRLTFLDQSQRVISGFDELKTILARLNHEDKFTLATQHQDLITNVDELTEILHRLNSKDRLRFAGQSQRVITDIDALMKVLDLLNNKEDRLSLATQYQALITSADKLNRVLKTLNEDNDLAFARQNLHLINTITDLRWVLDGLKAGVRPAFATQLQRLITYADNLALVIRELNERDRLDFATQHRELIIDASDLTMVISELDERDRAAFATQYYELITDAEELTWIIVELNERDRVSIATQHHGLITDVDKLLMVLWLLDEGDRIALASQCQAVITDADALAKVLRKLDRSHRVDFAAQHKALITNDAQQATVFETLNKIDQLKLTKILRPSSNTDTPGNNDHALFSGSGRLGLDPTNKLGVASGPSS